MYRKQKFLRGFTLTEALVIVIIIGILAGIGIPAYQKTVAAQKSRVCQNHLRILNMSLKLYTLDNNALPASLSEVWPKYTGMALAQWEREKRKSKLYCFVSRLRKLGLPVAHADALPSSYYNNDISILSCPADKIDNGISYGLNEDLVGLTPAQLPLLPDVLSIVDSEQKTVDFTKSAQIEYRHQTGFWVKRNFANAITLGAMPVSTAKEEYETALGKVDTNKLKISAAMTDAELIAANSEWKKLDVEVKKESVKGKAKIKGKAKAKGKAISPLPAGCSKEDIGGHRQHIKIEEKD